MTRLQKLTCEINNAGLDALMLSRASRINRRYLYGFSSSGGIFIVSATGESWLIIDRRYAEKAQSEAEKQGYELLIAENNEDYERLANEVCKKQGFKTLGFEDHITPVSALNSLKTAYDPELVPAGQLVEKLRISKSREEADLVRAAQVIAEKSLEEILPIIRPGICEKDVAKELVIRMYANGCDALSFPTFCLSGPNSSKPHGETGYRIIQEGDFVMLDFGVVKDGYFSDMTRTFAVGHATDEMYKVYNTVLEAQLKALQMAKIGMTCHELDNVARAHIEGAGFAKSDFAHLLGHGLGLSIAESPLVDAGVNMPLPEGALFTVEPGIYLPGRMGVRIEDMIWLGADGIENLTTTPKELKILR